MTISFVIPNYNGEELLKKNIPKVLAAASSYADDSDTVEVIVVDDCSSDGSLAVLYKLQKQIQSKRVAMKIISHKKNRGFSSAVNSGARVATGEILVLLNTDAYPEQPTGFINSFVGLFKDKNLFAVGFMDKSEEDGLVVLRGRGIGRWQKGFLVHSRGEVDKTNTLWVSGGSSAFRREIWEKLGGMNEMYNPFYWEDVDLSYRAQKAGYGIYFHPKTVVIHEHGKGAIKSTKTAFTVSQTAYRNQIMFVWLNITDKELLLSHFFWLPYHLLKALIRWDTPFVYGFFQAFVRLIEVVKSRHKMQASFVKTDKEILSKFEDGE
jgi:GT2 family glycosyltransferase